MSEGSSCLINSILLAQSSESEIGVYTLIGIGIGFFLVVLCVSFALSRYRRCPSDRILVIWGGDKGLRCFHGGGQFVWPVIEESAYLSLEPIHCTIDLRNVVTSDNALISGQSTATVGITTDPERMHLAAEHLLGLTHETLLEQAMGIFKAQQRDLINELTVRDLKTNPQLVLDKLIEGASAELSKVGFDLIEFEVSKYPKVVDTAGSTHQSTSAQ